MTTVVIDRLDNSLFSLKSAMDMRLELWPIGRLDRGGPRRPASARPNFDGRANSRHCASTLPRVT